MPHLIVEYSANLERDVDISRVVAAIHAAALETGVFPIGGIRTRAERRDVYKDRWLRWAESFSPRQDWLKKK